MEQGLLLAGGGYISRAAGIFAVLCLLPTPLAEDPVPGVVLGAAFPPSAASQESPSLPTTPLSRDSICRYFFSSFTKNIVGGNLRWPVHM